LENKAESTTTKIILTAKIDIYERNEMRILSILARGRLKGLWAEENPA